MSRTTPTHREAAIQEGERIAAADEYFSARTWIMDTNDNRRIFDAGFDRAYALLSKLRAPVADERTQQCAVHLTLTRTLGALGVAFDPPGLHRAYTYKDQPLNIGTYRLGDACQEASAASTGDLIDRGLSLLKSLQARGFGVFEVDAAHRNSANALASAPVAGEEQPAVRKGETNG